MRKILLFISILVIFASCSSKPKFELEVNIQNDSLLTGKKLIVDQKIDGALVYSDTAKIKKANFTLKIPYEGPALLWIYIPESGIDDIMMVAEEGKITLGIESTKPTFGGTALNDRLQAFNQASDSVSTLFRQLDDNYQLQTQAGSITPPVAEEFRQKRRKLLKENTDRIIAFMEENIENPIGEYYFLTNYLLFPLERKLELNRFATDKLKKEVGIQ